MKSNLLEIVTFLIVENDVGMDAVQANSIFSFFLNVRIFLKSGLDRLRVLFKY